MERRSSVELDRSENVGGADVGIGFLAALRAEGAGEGRERLGGLGCAGGSADPEGGERQAWSWPTPSHTRRC